MRRVEPFSRPPLGWAAHDQPSDPRSRRAQRPAQPGDHRARRPRQDHAGGRAPAPDGHLPRERDAGRPRPGLRRPGAREGHHHPGQADDGGLPRRAAEHRRHPRPRRLRRRGGTRPPHGGRGAAAGGRLRGSAAPDAVRAAEGHAAPPAGDRGAEQDRPLRRASGGGPGRRLRAVHRPWGRCAPDRLPGGLHQRQGRHRHPRPGRARHGPEAPARPAGRDHSPAAARARPSPAAAGDEPDRQRLRRPHGGRAHPQRDHPHRPAGDRRPRGRGGHRRLDPARPDRDAERVRDLAPDGPRHRSRRHHRGGRRRHRVGGRAAGGHHRRHHHRPGTTRARSPAWTWTRPRCA